MSSETVRNLGRVRPHLRFGRLRADPEAFDLVQAIARRRNTSISALLKPSRGRDSDAAARFLAMYLIHVVLGRPQEVVAALFGRDRTTVLHACQRLEDQRENRVVEAEITRLQRRLRRRAAIIRAQEMKHAA